MTQSQGHFSFSWCPANKELGGTSSRTADPEWPGGYPISCDTKVGEFGGNRCCLWASVCGQQLHCASLIEIFFYHYYYYFPFLSHSIKLCISAHKFYFFSHSPHLPHCGWVSEQLCGTALLLGDITAVLVLLTLSSFLFLEPSWLGSKYLYFSTTAVKEIDSVLFIAET